MNNNSNSKNRANVLQGALAWQGRNVPGIPGKCPHGDSTGPGTVPREAHKAKVSIYDNN
jgi:hypothetical protein